MTVINKTRVPYTTVTKETRVYKVQYTTVTKEIRVCCQKISKRKAIYRQDLNVQYWELKIELKQITNRII